MRDQAGHKKDRLEATIGERGTAVNAGSVGIV
jgi:hypothetical protein